MDNPYLITGPALRRDAAQPGSVDRDMWSAVSGNLDNARKRMRK